MVAAWETIQFTTAATKVHDCNTEILCSEDLADAAYIVRIRATLESMQQNYDRLLFVCSEPVDVDEISVLEFETFTAKTRANAPSEQKGPQSLQVRVA